MGPLVNKVTAYYKHKLVPTGLRIAMRDLLFPALLANCQG